jgi:diaminohydroxyphosphoribosylaminopyrimidine deaminase/5-amino-6-(5-phosphoribosylamino)uracil reductase
MLGKGALIATASSDATWQASIASTGATVLQLEEAGDGLNVDQLMAALGRRSVMSLLVEGGPTLLRSLLEEDQVDEVHAYVAPLLLGPAGLPLLPPGGAFLPSRLRDVQVEVLPPDVLVRGYTGEWTATS